ncbi:MAG: zf-HC2 domain-containing protein [Candidatus Cloacimonetes bacterium]|jgi:anti-sigma factor RsiW|nr:zf-HC2 domain-containing protein [Candidatus Cloacimonadota bacterium]
MKQKNECSFEKKLNAYIAGELSEMEHNKVRMHISSCHLCQNEIRTLQQVDNFLFQYTEKEVPAGLNEKILNSVPKTSTNPFMRKVISFSIAASVLISFMAGIMLSSGLYADSSDSNITIGEDSLFSYYEGDYDV